MPLEVERTVPRHRCLRIFHLPSSFQIPHRLEFKLRLTLVCCCAVLSANWSRVGNEDSSPTFEMTPPESSSVSSLDYTQRGRYVSMPHNYFGGNNGGAASSDNFSADLAQIVNEMLYILHILCPAPTTSQTTAHSGRPTAFSPVGQSLPVMLPLPPRLIIPSATSTFSASASTSRHGTPMGSNRNARKSYDGPILRSTSAPHLACEVTTSLDPDLICLNGRQKSASLLPPSQDESDMILDASARQHIRNASEDIIIDNPTESPSADSIDVVTVLCSTVLSNLAQISECRASLVQGKALQLLAAWLDLSAAVWYNKRMDCNTESKSRMRSNTNTFNGIFNSSFQEELRFERPPLSQRPDSTSFSSVSLLELVNNTCASVGYLTGAAFKCSSARDANGVEDLFPSDQSYRSSNYAVGWIDAQVIFSRIFYPYIYVAFLISIRF